jgi:hypothetical protein
MPAAAARADASRAAANRPVNRGFSRLQANGDDGHRSQRDGEAGERDEERVTDDVAEA